VVLVAVLALSVGASSALASGSLTWPLNRDGHAEIGRAAATTGVLEYRNGPVLHASAPYLVFWTPPGQSIPATSKRLIERFLTDAAADSGKADDMFGVLRQYYDHLGFADYRQRFDPVRQVIVDTHAYPPEDRLLCPDVSVAYPTCISDQQIHLELQRLIAAKGLPRWVPSKPFSFAPIYFVVLPADVATCEVSGQLCSDKENCAYHQTVVASNGWTLFAVLPLDPLRNLPRSMVPKGVCQGDGTRAVQAPNGHILADVLIGALSHEYSEAITDPLYSFGWFAPGVGGIDAAGQEVGDECESTGPFNPPVGFNPDAFLPTLGGSEPAGTLFTQLINGHRYYTQSEWSNGNSNCEMRPSPGTIAPRFTVPAGAVPAGSTVRLNPAASTSAHPYSSATWKFGDGSKGAFLYGPATLTPVEHAYTTAGRYTITLTLVDNRGNLQTTTRRVTVHRR
jgi:hypothetical protein